MLKERSTQHKVNQDAYAIVMRALIDWPADCYKLAEESGLALLTLQDLMRTFKRRGVVFIAGWNRDTMGRDTTPIFALKLKATDRDVERRVMTAAERQAARRKRKGIAPISERIKNAMKGRHENKCDEAAAIPAGHAGGLRAVDDH